MKILPHFGLRHVVFALYLTATYVVLTTLPVDRLIGLVNTPLVQRPSPADFPQAASPPLEMAMAAPLPVPTSALSPPNDVGTPEKTAAATQADAVDAIGRVVAANGSASLVEPASPDIDHAKPEPAHLTGEVQPKVSETMQTPALTQPHREAPSEWGDLAELDLQEKATVASAFTGYAGIQEGFQVPPLLFEGPGPDMVASLVASGEVALWLKATSGGKLWFVPPSASRGAARIGSTDLRALVDDGSIVGNPQRGGLTVTGADGARLREIPFDAGSGLVPMHLFADLAARSAGAASLTHGGLRLSPVLEDTIIARQSEVLDQLGLAGQPPEVWPDGLRMVGCWTASGKFIISRTTQSDGPHLQSDNRCRH